MRITEVKRFEHLIGQGKRYSQKASAYERNVTELYTRKHRKKPKSDFMDGLRYTQARSLRVMFAHYKRAMADQAGQPTEPAHLEEDPDFDDAALQSGLKAYAETREAKKDLSHSRFRDWGLGNLGMWKFGGGLGIWD